MTRPTWDELRERAKRMEQPPVEYSEWQCPNCGWDSQNGDSEDSEQVTYSAQQRDNAAEIVGSAGGPAYFWTETWTCPECGTEFSFENSNY